MRDSESEMQHSQGRFRRAAQDAGMRNDNGNAVGGGVRREGYFAGAGLKAGRGGDTSREGLTGT
jgi:hypothetical protein